MAKVVGVGGIFFKSPEPDRLYRWYAKHLGIEKHEDPGVSFANSDQPNEGYTVWSIFQSDTRYFEPAEKAFMFNFVVDDLDGALRQVVVGGATLVGEPETYDFGRFGWFIDPDGNKVELWQPSVNTRS